MFDIIEARQNDLEMLVGLRLAFFEHINEPLIQEEHVHMIKQRLKEYFTAHLEQDDFVALLARAENEIAGTVFLTVYEMPAHTALLTGKTGTILNVLVLPKYQRLGLATQMIQKIISIAKERDLSAVNLSATPAGAPLYKKLGFIPSKYEYMRLFL